MAMLRFILNRCSTLVFPSSKQPPARTHLLMVDLSNLHGTEPGAFRCPSRGGR